MALSWLSCFAVIALAAASGASKLQAYNIDPDSVTTSGISAGAFFSVQFHIAFSSLVKGAGIVAGGPYYCAKDAEMTALTTCMSTGMVNDKALLTYASGQESKGTIDALANLQTHSVVLWSGTSDHTVAQSVMKHLHTQYASLKVPDIVTLFNFSAGHGWPTDFYGNRCGATASPYITNCNYDYAGEIFHKWYGPSLAPRVETPPSTNLKTFSQAEFIAPMGRESLANTGYVYVPTSCAQGKQCRLHVNFHGCEQYAGTVGTTYVSHTGLNRWAEANDIVVLYPQTKSSTLSPSNPNGCFDWWGYAGSNYATKEGKQMKSVKAMVDRVMSGSKPSPPTPPPTPSPPTPPPTPSPPTPPPTPSPPTPPPPAPTPPPAATCTGKPGGDTCISDSEYIICPAGITQKCFIGKCHQLAPGASFCAPGSKDELVV